MAPEEDSRFNSGATAPPKWRLFSYLIVGGFFPLLAWLVPPLFAFRTVHEHALLDLGIALSACFCSLQAFVRYQSRPQPLFLWLGAGFLASGLLDGLHTLASLAPAPDSAAEPRGGAWGWIASSLVLGVYLTLGLARSRGADLTRGAQWRAAGVGAITLIIVTGVIFAVLKLPLPPVVFSEFPVHRPYEFGVSAVMLLALVLAWRRDYLLDAALRNRFGAALAIYAGLHAGVMAWSALPLDIYVAISHLARLLAHWLVLVGLLQSSASLLTEAQNSRRQLAAQAEKLEISERHIRSIVNHAPFGILGADAQGIVRNFNPVAETMFGIEHAKAIGRPLRDFFDDGIQKELAVALGPHEQTLRARLQQIYQPDEEEASRSRRALSSQANGLRASGEAFPIALTLTDTVAGGHRFFTAFVRDLTRTIEQEQKTHQALTLATQILDQSSVAILSTDDAGVITRFNGTAQRWLGYDEREVCGRMTPVAFLDPEQLQHHARQLLAEHAIPMTSDTEIILAQARRGQPSQGEWTLLRKDGSHLPAHIAVAPLAAEGGQVSGFVLVATDLSQQKEVEKLKNEFVSTVSHELRTPLTSVRGSLGLLAGGIAGKLPAQAQSLLEIAQRNTERLILLINDILDIEKIEAGKMRFNLRSVDLDALVADAMQSAEGLAATRSVRLVRGRKGAVRVFVDDHRLVQVLTNLLSNAIKFSLEGGTIEVDAQVQDNRARVTVTDHGSGIPEASQSRIFQKFFQADSSSTREKSGTGLGLSICKALVERMDGHLGFTSRPGQTTFFFELPCDARGAGGTAPRVLVVEDDPDAAAVLCQILRQAGFDTDTARTAAAAREQLQKRRYDCMTLDVLLPDQSGLTLLGELRRQEYARELPIIVVSIYEPDQQSQAAASAARVTDWLTKPVDSARLLASVQGALRHGRRSKSVLFVEDDRAMGELLRHLLSDFAQVTIARTLAEGREQIENHDFSLVLLDFGLPDGIGQDLLPVLQKAQPQTPVLVFSENDFPQERAGSVSRTLSKSRTPNEELVRIVQDLLNPPEPSHDAAKNPAG